MGNVQAHEAVVRGVYAAELQGLSFACLEGCGFCCTFTPEVGPGELARLRARFPRLPVQRSGGPGGALHLAFQGGCGACVLLQRRRCTAYEDRPAHCRHFPFHVYFGRRTEAYVNRSCRGVGPRMPQSPGDAPDAQGEPGRLPAAAAFQAQVLAVAPAALLAEREREARKVHAEFERRARAAGAWGDADAALRDAAAQPQFAVAPAPHRWEAALAPFAEEDVVARPFYLDGRLRWLTFARDGGRLQVLEMQEDGSLAPEGTELRPEPRPVPTPAAAGLQQVLFRLAGRDVMAGQAFDLVDASRYRLPVERAARERVAQAAADLAVRAQVLQALGVPEGELAAEAERFYDAAFLDAPTIGGWL